MVRRTFLSFTLSLTSLQRSLWQLKRVPSTKRTSPHRPVNQRLTNGVYKSLFLVQSVPMSIQIQTEWGTRTCMLHSAVSEIVSSVMCYRKHILKTQYSYCTPTPPPPITATFLSSRLPLLATERFDCICLSRA